MSRFFSNKYLKYRRALTGALIDDDRSCDDCGYNLRGLRFGGRCPECGASIVVADTTRDALSDAPLPDIRRLRAGLGLAMACVPLLVLAPVFTALARGKAMLIAMSLLGVTILWMVGVWLMTPAFSTPGGIKRGFTEGSRLRDGARWLQLGWPVFVLLFLVLPGIPGTSRGAIIGLRIAGVLVGVAAVGGVVLLALMLMRLAEWCYNDFAEKYLNWAVWGLLVWSVAFVLANTLVLFRFLGPAFVILWAISFLYFFLALFSLGKSVAWSVVHARERLDRDRALRDSVKGGAA